MPIASRGGPTGILFNQLRSLGPEYGLADTSKALLFLRAFRSVLPRFARLSPNDRPRLLSQFPTVLPAVRMLSFAQLRLRLWATFGVFRGASPPLERVLESGLQAGHHM